MHMTTPRPHLRAGITACLLGAALLGLGFTWAHSARMTTPDALQRERADDGEKIYLSRCMSCHQVDGTGIPGVFPPLDGTDWVVGDKGRLIRIILDGMMGEAEIQGVVYSGAMPPWKTFMNDEEIAAVLTYIRSAWSNEGSAVTPQEVAAVREATKDRTTSWTAEELSQEANQGIPGAFDFLAPADSTDDQ